MLVHGRGRAAARQFRAFLPMAIARGVALIAPTFPAQRFSGYQYLAGTDGPLCARDALLGTLDDAWQHLGVGTDEVDLVGFSGGAQFAHRFAMSAPGRVRRAVVAAAGWYTYLDEDRPFPRGAGAAPPAASAWTSQRSCGSPCTSWSATGTSDVGRACARGRRSTAARA